METNKLLALQLLAFLWRNADTNALADSIEDALGAAAVEGVREAKKAK